MAQRLSHKFYLPVLALVFIPLSALRTDAQSPGQPSPPPLNGGTAPKPPEPSAAAKELSAQEVDGLLEKAFGKDSPELRRPIRMWIPDIGMVIAAEKASVARDGSSVRFTSARIAMLDPEETKGEVQILGGDEIVIAVDRPIKQQSELRNCQITVVAVHDKNSLVTVTPRADRLPRHPIGPVTEGSGLPLAPPQKIAVQPKPPDLKDAQPLPQSGAIVIEARRPVEVRFKFKIDPYAPLGELLPALPKTSAKLPLWTNEDLAKVPELTFGEPISKALSKHKALETTAHVMAKINHLNLKRTDGFILAMIEQRPDLRGLPFIMGEECRMREEQARLFARAVKNIHGISKGNVHTRTEALGRFWTEMGMRNQDAQMQPSPGKNAGVRASTDRLYGTTIAALMQILMPEPDEVRFGLAKFLATVPHPDATKALAKLAIFSPEDEVRAAALEGLKLRRDKDYTDILLQGFHYPLPAVSKRAAEVLVMLERKDLLANLIKVLESPDPRLPVTEKRDGKDVTFVRELVKVNHHRNCLLCHAPGNTQNVPEGVLKVAVPLATEPLPQPSDGGGYQSTPPPSPDIVVRLDMTYLRQDFSLMMPVSDAHPWPEMQRFDFLVRTRTLTAQEVRAYEPCCEGEEPGRLSPYHRSALYALRELTGRDTEPTAAAWRKLLKLAAR